MKIIHTGDIHIGAAMKSLPPDKTDLRKREIMDGFKNLAAFARDNGVQAVLIAGDLFDENKVPRQVRNEAFAIISAARPVWFFYVSGNHDDEFEEGESLPENLYTFSGNHGWQSYDLPEGVTVTGVDTKNLSPELYDRLALRQERCNVLLMHGEAVKSEPRGTESIPLSRLQNKYVDYLALGHIHKPMRTAERLDGRGVYRYCGCPEGRGFDECGERGFFLLELRGGRIVDERFLSFAKRTVVERTADISACENYFDVERAAEQVLADVRAGDMVRLTLIGKYKAGLCKNISLLTERLNEKFFFARVEDSSKIYIDYTAYQNDLSERGEFVREVGRYEINEELRAEILDVGLKALAGEEIDL